ncbi:MAG TPA: hypothetical protein DD379_11675 [Cyanobacteria bacterium UBA11162]|nr:hypothetical protein [Cyanobacteria bacterium UBA11162]
METQPKINLIYIASIGRSGSTLLESMLGAHSQIATCGEIHIWPHEIVQRGVRLCSCGKSILDCPFWIEMKQRVNPLHQPQPQIHFFREQHNAGKTLRLKRLRDFNPREVYSPINESIKVYSQNNYQVFQAFLDVMQEIIGVRFNWLVDASKDPYRLLWLIRSNLFNIKVLHVVKNPFGFVYSVTKNLLKDEMTQVHQLFYDTARQSVKWSIENHLISQIAQNHLKPDDYLLINYEQLASKPTQTFQKVCELIGCSFEEEAVNNFRQGSLHTIAGNPMRYEKKGIVLDEKWKTYLPESSQRIVEIMTWLNRAYYGYD